MMLNTGILMMLMMVEIKSIFSSATFMDLSEKKTRQIMFAGLATGILIDLPIEISWFFYDFTTKVNGLSFLIIYNVSMFSLMFCSLTFISLRLICELNSKETHSGAFKAEKRNLVIMLLTFDSTFLLWVCYYAFLLPHVVNIHTQDNHKFTVDALSIVLGAILGVTPLFIIMWIHHLVLSNFNLIISSETTSQY